MPNSAFAHAYFFFLLFFLRKLLQGCKCKCVLGTARTRGKKKQAAFKSKKKENRSACACARVWYCVVRSLARMAGVPLNRGRI